MAHAIHIKTIVLPGHKIELTSPELLEGQSVEVIVTPAAPSPEPKSMLEIIAELNGHRLFKSPEEVDRHLQQERDAWDH